MQKLKPLFELELPGQYFQVNVINQSVYISFLPIQTRDSTKHQPPGRHITRFPLDNPRRLYEAFHNLKFGMLYKEVKFII